MIKTSIVACQLTEKFEPRGSLKIETFPYGWMADLYLGGRDAPSRKRRERKVVNVFLGKCVDCSNRKT